MKEEKTPVNELEYFSSQFTPSGIEHLFFFTFEGIKYHITKMKLFVTDKTRYIVKTQWYDKKLKKFKSSLRTVTHQDKKQRIITAFKEAVKEAGIKPDKYSKADIERYRKLTDKKGYVSRIDY